MAHPAAEPPSHPGKQGWGGGEERLQEDGALPPLDTKVHLPGCLLCGSPGKDKGTGQDHGHTPPRHGRAM